MQGQTVEIRGTKIQSVGTQIHDSGIDRCPNVLRLQNPIWIAAFGDGEHGQSDLACGEDLIGQRATEQRQDRFHQGVADVVGGGL